jgi:hypothetical protein
MTNFTREATLALGVILVDLTVETNASSTDFFVVDAKPSYFLLLGRYWIHANWCIPSMLHQMLMLWNGDKVETVLVDPDLFKAEVQMSEAIFYSPTFQPI